MKLYLAGKIGETLDFKEKFFNASHELRMRGHDVINPVEINWVKIQNGKHVWEECMRADIRELMTCEAICLLPDWTSSKGARLEFWIAMQVGIPSVMYAEVLRFDSSIEWMAQGLVLQPGVATAEERDSIRGLLDEDL